MLFLKPKKDVNEGVKEYKNTPNAVLIDVRTPKEYEFARIPKSVNLPLAKLKSTHKLISDKTTPIFVYCTNGGRADRAVKRLQRMGYQNVKSIGGISRYRGKVEQG